MKTVLALCLLLLAATPALAITTTPWEPPTERVDGMPLAEAEIAQVNLYCAPSLSLWFMVSFPIEEDQVEFHKADELGMYCEDYWCALTVTDYYGNESDYSNVVVVPGPCP